MPSMSFVRAIRLGLSEAMEEDSKVVCWGEEVGYGGPFGATQGLQDRFGPARVRDTPIVESAIVGYAVGAAMVGLRPVAEIMQMDFAACGMDQIVNQAAKLRYMSGGTLSAPLVIRMGVGGGLRAGAQHSQSLEAWFIHSPGLVVVTAGTPNDIRNVIRAAIHDDNPVIVLEPLQLFEVRGEVSAEADVYVLGQATVKRLGQDVTLVAWGAHVPVVLQAADVLVRDGIQADVIDLLTLSPWDEQCVLESVARTRRAVVVHQAPERGGFGAEIASTITEHLFSQLSGPVKRVCGLNVPVPFSPIMEDYVLPDAARVVSAVREFF